MTEKQIANKVSQLIAKRDRLKAALIEANEDLDRAKTELSTIRDSAPAKAGTPGRESTKAVPKRAPAAAQ